MSAADDSSLRRPDAGRSSSIRPLPVDEPIRAARQSKTNSLLYRNDKVYGAVARGTAPPVAEARDAADTIAYMLKVQCVKYRLMFDFYRGKSIIYCR